MSATYRENPKTAGSGIGLAMTFRVAHLHSGTVDLSSELGQGTTFRLRFPASPDSRLAFSVLADAVGRRAATV